MNPIKLAINSRTSGKFRKETIGGREHIVTTMMPIRGDITMNGIFYPNSEVKASFEQLDMMPAPSGHPVINGEHVSAHHPVAVNAFNIGGFVRTPKMKGKRVFNEYCLDVEVANRCDAGKQMISNIEEGKKVGVSTGLTINSVENKAGTDDFGKAYNRIGRGFKFDHVAVLLNEAAAGEHAGTELILNGDRDMEVNLEVNELSTSEMYTELNDAISVPEGHSWVQEIYPDSRTFVYSFEAKGSERKLYLRAFDIDENDEVKLASDVVEVERKTEYEPVEKVTNKKEGSIDMDKEKIILAVIANSANAYTDADKGKLESMDEVALVAALSVNETEIVANALKADTGYAGYIANKDNFTAFQEAEKTRLDVIRNSIVANSDYTIEMLAGKDEAELNVLNALAPAKTADHLGSDKINTNSAESSAVDYT